MSFSSGFSDGFLSTALVNERLAHMEWCEVWEPGLPISSDGLGQADKQQLLWGYPGVSWAIPVDNTKLAHMEWCTVWEPGLPVNPGTIGQDDQQQLLWGYPDILWEGAEEEDVAGRPKRFVLPDGRTTEDRTYAERIWIEYYRATESPVEEAPGKKRKKVRIASPETVSLGFEHGLFDYVPPRKIEAVTPPAKVSQVDIAFLRKLQKLKEQDDEEEAFILVLANIV